MVDLGAGDGGYVVATAVARPDVLVIGIDAQGPAMAPAARTIQRRHIANALLVAARAEALPPELDGLAGDIRVHFPWGSLLRGVLTGEEAVVSGLARIARPGGTVTAVLSVTMRERSLDLPVPAAGLAAGLARHYAASGLTLTDWRPASEREIAESRSSWAKRLGAGQRRDAWLLRARRCAP